MKSFFQDTVFVPSTDLTHSQKAELIDYYNKNKQSSEPKLRINDLNPENREKCKSTMKKLRLFFHPDKSGDFSETQKSELAKLMTKLSDNRIKNINPNSRLIRIVSAASDMIIKTAAVDCLMALILFRNKDFSKKKCIGIYIGLCIALGLAYSILTSVLTNPFIKEYQADHPAMKKLDYDPEEAKLKYDIFVVDRAKGRKATLTQILTPIIYNSILLSTIFMLGKLEKIEKEFCNKLLVVFGIFSVISAVFLVISIPCSLVAQKIWKEDDFIKLLETNSESRDKMLSESLKNKNIDNPKEYFKIITFTYQFLYPENSILNTIVAHARVNKIFDEERQLAV
jgi:hypothetical protein